MESFSMKRIDMMDKMKVMEVNIYRNKNENTMQVLAIWKHIKFCATNWLYRIFIIIEDVK